MLRRTCAKLGGDRVTPIFLDNAHLAPPSSECKGFFFKPLNGPYATLRFFDFKWIMNRMIQLGRDGYIAGPLFYVVVFNFWWTLPQSFLWGDGKPPRTVEWNTEKCGYLPKGASTS